MKLYFFALSLILLFLPDANLEEASDGTEEAEPETLPEPLAYRGAPRPSQYNPRNNFDSLLYDRKASLKSSPVSNVAEQMLSSRYGDAKYDEDLYVRSESDYGSLPAASSDYGSYASESGYGHSCSSGYVNASAVALLAFLFLLNLVQDIIQQITAGNRRRRDLEEEEQSAALQFIRDGGLDALKEGLPEIVVPLMVKLSDANETRCIARPLCDANAELSLRYGPIGRVFATLLSNVASHAFTNRDAKAFQLSQRAAFQGRNQGSCNAFTQCNTRQPSSEGFFGS